MPGSGNPISNGAAVLVPVEGAQVVLRTTDGHETLLPIRKLSDADQEYLSNRATSGQGGLLTGSPLQGRRRHHLSVTCTEIHYGRSFRTRSARWRRQQPWTVSPCLRWPTDQALSASFVNAVEGERRRDVGRPHLRAKRNLRTNVGHIDLCAMALSQQTYARDETCRKRTHSRRSGAAASGSTGADAAGVKPLTKQDGSRGLPPVSEG